jgi:PKD repeat protein
MVGPDAVAEEGTPFARDGSFLGAGAGPWTATVDYGDGAGARPLPLHGQAFALAHTYPDNGTYAVTVTITDGHGVVGSAAFVVVVAEVAPVVQLGPDLTVGQGEPFAGAGSFTDPGADTWTAMVDYGDGTGPQALALAPDRTFALGHTYAAPGTYAVAVAIEDDDGGRGSATFTVTVDQRAAPTALIITSASQLALDDRDRVTVSARLTWRNGTDPLPGQVVAFAAGGVVATATTDADGVATATLVLPSEQYTLTASFAGDANLLPSQATRTVIAFQVTQFVIWGGNAGGLATGQACQFWSAQWAKQVTGGDYQANNSFKGYADILSPEGKTWAASPGGSGNPPATVGRYILVIVSEHASKDGATIRGTVDGHAIVRVDAPQHYRPDPGGAGTGIIIAKLP